MWYGWNKETFLGARGDDCWQVCFTEKGIETVIYYNKDLDYGKYLSKQWNVGLLEEFKEWEEKKHKTFIKCCNGNRKEDSRKKIHNKVIWGRYRLDIYTTLKLWGHDKKLLPDGDIKDEPNCEWLCSHAQADRET